MNNKLKLIVSFILCLNFSAFAQQYNGWTLTSVMNSSTATLIDTNQATVKTWSGLTGASGYSSYLMPGGILVRGAKGAAIPAGAPGGPTHGQLQKHDYSGSLIWNYKAAGADYIAHHDICPMPNGNVLAIVYHKVPAAQVTAAGGNSAIDMWPDKIIEVQPGANVTDGTIVWEWRIWDHIMQNVDAAKPNYYANVIDHPELLNINYKQAKDWIHMNGVDYNPILDQIVVSSHNLNEWYVIDHSTTTAEAASHSGGNSGKGGDFLYRWGNPAAYGAAGTAILNVTHDAHWIPEGCPNAGRLVGFNNKGQANPSISTIDQIVPPINGYNYNYTAGQAYSPATYDSRHVTNLYSTNMGNSQQLPNGNQLVCVATTGKVYEIDAAGNQLWIKTFQGSVPQAFKYDSCYIFNAPPAIPTVSGNATTLTSSTATTYQWYMNGVLIPGATSMTYNPTVSGIYVVRITDAKGCVFRYSTGFKFTKWAAGIAETNLSENVTVYPNPVNDILKIEDNNQLGNQFTIQITDYMGNIVYKTANAKEIDVRSLSNGLYLVQIFSKNGNVTQKINIIK
jgi:hypothetical protein